MIADCVTSTTLRAAHVCMCVCGCVCVCAGVGAEVTADIHGTKSGVAM